MEKLKIELVKPLMISIHPLSESVIIFSHPSTTNPNVAIREVLMESST